MYDDQIEELISMALADGVLSEKEKQILFKRAAAAGIDLDEFEMVLNNRLALLNKEPNNKSIPVAPQTVKYGKIRKCPLCGAILKSFQTKCPDCGYEFKNISTVQSAQKLFDLLQEIELNKSKTISKYEIERQQRLDELSERHNSDDSFVKLLGGKTRHEIYDEERKELIKELNRRLDAIEKEILSKKRSVILNYPVPNTKEDLLELLAMSTSNSYDNDGVVGPEEEVWIRKTNQIYQKIVLCAANDKAFLTQATNLVVSLMKRLPSSYRRFLQLPGEVAERVREELKIEGHIKHQTTESVARKKRGIYAIVSFLVAGAALFSLGFVGFIITLFVLYVVYRIFIEEHNN